MKRKPNPNATAPGVSRFLGRFEDRSESDSTSVRGWRHVSQGFEVWDPKEEGGGTVIVEHQLGEYGHRILPERQVQLRQNALRRYAGILRVKYDVQVDLKQERLVVTTKEDEE